jgi:transposase InsO family protein
MEALVENLTRTRYKSKMDLRSGFWQVGLTARAKEYTAFTTPSGRCYMWKVMPFGLAGAPAVFQEMMEILANKVRNKKELQPILKEGFVGAFFDDCGIGSKTEMEHLILLEEFLKVCEENSIRIKLAKCDFMVESLEYLGYNIGWGVWTPSKKRVESILRAKIKTLADLRSFLGAANFYRRHVPGFTFTTARLTDKLKKGNVWSWTQEDEKLVEELKSKLANVKKLGVPRSEGTMVLVTDASDLGGGSSLYQWQSLHHEQIPENCRVEGIQQDGKFVHSFPSFCALVPLGHWNWKWNEARAKYDVYQRELLSGILTIGAQFRILAGLNIVWFCDNSATKTFLDAPPPMNARLRRWYTFLSQFKLSFFHLPGMKNEMCDYFSRNAFDDKFGVDMDALAQEAFARMDSQLDLSMQQIFRLQVDSLMTPTDYKDSEFQEVWDRLRPFQSELIDEMLFFRTEKLLFCERLLVVTEKKLEEILLWCHQQNGHPGSEKNLLFFLRYFYSAKSKTELMKMMKSLVEKCETCLRAKPNQAPDRGLMSCLPIPQISNQLLFIDFIAMDNFNGMDYVLTIVDALTRFVRFVVCNKNITGEGTLKLILSEWISHYGCPKEILSDNDVRFSSEKGFYQRAFSSLGIETKFSLPRHPESNGLCERINRSFIQNIRILSLDKRTVEWPKLVPFVTFIMNSQVSPQTGYTPHELFLGKEAWKFTLDAPIDPGVTPSVKEWLEENLKLQEMASKRLAHIRAMSNKRANRFRVRSSFQKGEYVLVHKSRWPQRKLLKVESPWLGPFQVVEVRHAALKVAVSPHLGGYVDVALDQVKRWAEVIEVGDEVPDEVTLDEEKSEPGDHIPEATEAENFPEKDGFYQVEAILKHKYRQGWRFLTKWEGFPISSSTWEPQEVLYSRMGG